MGCQRVQTKERAEMGLQNEQEQERDPQWSLADNVWLSESGVVIALLEAALLISQDPRLSEEVSRSALVDVRNHYSDDMGQLSVFASLSFEAYGHLRLGGFDDDRALVRMELRDPGTAPLFAWEVPVEYFLDANLRRSTSEHRVATMMRAVRNALDRADVTKAVVQPVQQDRPRRLFNPRKAGAL